MKLIAKLVLAAFAATASLTAGAEDPKSQGYLVDSGGKVVRSGDGLCWQHRDPDQPAIDPSCNPVIRPVAVIPAARPAVIATATPAPTLQPEPARPLTRRISFSGDALFAFDKAVLKTEGRAMLDGLVLQLDGATYDTIIATGHTDRFGSNEYNQKLSERRAHAVKDYLVSKNVQASRIDAQGKGETQSVTVAGNCLGAKSAKVIACLQPDRRVDVEMTGTQTVTSSR